MQDALLRWLNSSVGRVTSVFVIIASIFAAAWAWPKTVKCPNNGHRAHYIGFLWGGSGPLGPRYFRITGPSGYEIQYTSPGYNSFELLVPEYSFHVAGTCLVELRGPDSIPVPDVNNIQNAVSYKPDGTLGSEIHDGTGFFTFWHSNGTKFMESKYEDFQAVRDRWWYGNGQLLNERYLSHGRENGPYVAFNRDGSKAIEGMNADGEKVGPWTHYRPDGRIEKVEHYEQGRLIRTEFPEIGRTKNDPH